MNPTIILFRKYVFRWTKKQIKTFTKPAIGTIAISSLSDLSQTRANLIAENAFLRQQSIIINRKIVKEYVKYYIHARPHQGINQRVPSRNDQEKTLTYSSRVKIEPVLNGLHHDYSQASQLH